MKNAKNNKTQKKTTKNTQKNLKTPNKKTKKICTYKVKMVHIDNVQNGNCCRLLYYVYISIPSNSL